MNTAIAKIKALPSTKKDQKSFSNEIIKAIVEGEVNPLKIDSYLKSIENVLYLIRKDVEVKQLVLNEAEKYGEKSFDAFNAVITISKKTTYDYTKDSVWNKLKAKIKARETLLKSVINSDSDIVDTDTGEILEEPKVKYSHYLKYEFK